MTIGVFVQLNADSPWGASRKHPVGYIVQESGCWDWVGGTNGLGYGRMQVDGRSQPAHRVLYERHRGTIPEGMYIDHLCKNRSCVNPDHLEVVTNGENVLRGNGPTAQNRRKSSCPKGHPYTSRKDGSRVCLTCWKAHQKRYRAERRKRQHKEAP